MTCDCYAKQDHSSDCPACYCKCHVVDKIKKDMGICTLAEDVGQLQKNIRELDQDLGRAIERIDELEFLVGKFDLEKLQSILLAGVQTHASILRCEAALKKLEDLNNRQNERNVRDNARIKELERLIKEPQADRVSKDTIHVECPYCRGHGKIAMCSPGE